MKSARFEYFGFSPASDFGLGNEYGVDEHFMAIVKEGALAEAGSVVKYQPEFEEAAC